MNTDIPVQQPVQPVQSAQPIEPVLPPVSPPSVPDHVVTKKWFLIVLGIVVLVVIIGVAQLLTNGTNQSNTSAIATPTNKPTPIHDYPVSMTIVPITSQIRVGESATFNIIINAPGQSLDGADSIVTYDPAMFEGSIVETSGFPSYLKKRVDMTKGRITITGVTFEPKPTPQSGNLVFAQVSFKAKRAGMGTIAFVFTKGDKSLSTVIENGTSYTILGSVEGAKITVTN